MKVVSFTLGPVATNVYLLGDPETGVAAVIDPAWDGKVVVEEAGRRGWRIAHIWLTHAHFDHFGGAGAVAHSDPEAPVPVALHPADLPLWQSRGGATLFGVRDFDPGPEPTVALQHGTWLQLGRHRFEVRHAPGHSPGHVIFVEHEARLAFCGDVIFMSGVGRTDLPGGDWGTLLRSIREQVLSLPDETQLLTGHGPATSVGRERRVNPFLVEI